MSNITYWDVEGTPVRINESTYTAEAFDSVPPRRVTCVRAQKNGVKISASDFAALCAATRASKKARTSLANDSQGSDISRDSETGITLNRDASNGCEDASAANDLRPRLKSNGSLEPVGVRAHTETEALHGKEPYNPQNGGLLVFFFLGVATPTLVIVVDTLSGGELLSNRGLGKIWMIFSWVGLGAGLLSYIYLRWRASVWIERYTEIRQRLSKSETQ